MCKNPKSKENIEKKIDVSPKKIKNEAKTEINSASLGNWKLIYNL